MSTYLVLLSLAAAAAAQQQQYLPWEQQTDVGSIPAWYAPKTGGFAAQAGSSMAVAPPLGSLASNYAASSYAARPSYPPNFPGYPTFGTVQPVGPASKSGGNPYTTTHRPKTTTGYRPKPTGKSNLDKYLPLMKKKKASTTTTTTLRPTVLTTKRRKLPAKKTTVTRPTVKSTTVRPTTTVKTTTVDSTEWESLEIVEKASSTARATVQTTSTSKQTSLKPTTSTTRQTTSAERRKEEEKVEKKEEKKTELVKGPIVAKGRPTTVRPLPTTTQSLKSIEEEDKEAEFNLLGFLWDKSELLASIKNMIKQLKSSIDEAGLEEDVKQVSDHLKNTIKTFASASPVNEQLGRLFERAQNADVKLDD